MRRQLSPSSPDDHTAGRPSGPGLTFTIDPSGANCSRQPSPGDGRSRWVQLSPPSAERCQRLCWAAYRVPSGAAAKFSRCTWPTGSRGSRVLRTGTRARSPPRSRRM